MDIQGIAPSTIKEGTLVVVFKKIVWSFDPAFHAALQETVLVPFKWSARALNTKVLALPWAVPSTPEAAQAQHDVLRERTEIEEARGLVAPALDYVDDDGKRVPYLDGGELVLAVARADPSHLDDVITYLRAPQRADWFMDELAEIARAAKTAAARACIYDTIAQMPVPPKSNKHHKTYLGSLAEGAVAFREAGNEASAKRLEQKAAPFTKKAR